jgi:hypothetical protein
VNSDLLLHPACLAVPALALCVGMGRTLESAKAFDLTNLISATGAIPVAVIDPALVNPWGVSLNATSPFWISDEGTGVTQLNSSTAQPVAVAAAHSSHIGVAAPPGLTSNPTGQVSNNAVIAHRGGIQDQARANFPSTRSRLAAKAVWPAIRAVPVTERYPAWI